ncbi:MAG: hypothetical protein GY881_12895 [Gammaproteobacteria bacterium]|nr:hypothetical protein [Gammaproteobacteria bacterium]
MEYLTLAHFDTKVFDKSVNKHLKLGWKLRGKVAVVPREWQGGSALLVQTMIKDEAKPKTPVDVYDEHGVQINHMFPNGYSLHDEPSGGPT